MKIITILFSLVICFASLDNVTAQNTKKQFRKEFRQATGHMSSGAIFYIQNRDTLRTCVSSLVSKLISHPTGANFLRIESVDTIVYMYFFSGHLALIANGTIQCCDGTKKEVRIDIAIFEDGTTSIQYSDNGKDLRFYFTSSKKEFAERKVEVREIYNFVMFDLQFLGGEDILQMQTDLIHEITKARKT